MKDEDINPGQQLKLILEKIYPLNLNENISSISKLDNALMADGNFSELVYKSSINYMLRRLINTAEYIKRKYDLSIYPPEKYKNELRKFLKDYTRIPKSEVERVFILLIDCLKVRNKEPNVTTKRTLLKKARTNGLRCYICGRALNFEKNEIHEKNEIQESAEVEHEWPSAVGGSSEVNNLKISCFRCNKIKSDYIDSNDFHYEKISLIGNIDDRNFLKELKWDYRVALWLKSQCSCIICGKQASSEGELRLARIDLNDSWHFLNISAYCSNHAPE